MNTLNQLSQHAHEVDWIATTLLILSSVLVACVWLAIVFFCWRYHHKQKADRSNPPAQARQLELILCAVIFCFGLATFIWSAQQFYRLYLAPEGAHTVYVIGKQWMWTFHDPERGDQINQLVVKVNQPTRLVMTSEDVVHSFYIPNLRIKQDVLPGRYTSLWFTPDQVGEYQILCTQYCGLEHSMMGAVLKVVPENASAQTVSFQPGEQTFRKFGCASCHGEDSKSAPSLHGLYGSKVKLQDGRIVTADEDYLRRSILLPNADLVEGYPAVMPTFKGQLSEKDLFDLVGYIKTLGAK